MESTASVAYAAPDRGVCRVCRRDWPLAWTTGMVKRHRGQDGEPCPGGATPPFRPGDEQTVTLPD